MDIQYQLLSADEISSLQNFHIGIDSEFVSLVKEEIEVHSDGTRSTVRPSRLGLARVSCVRGIFYFSNIEVRVRYTVCHL